MSTNHTGNVQNQVLLEEHDGDLNAKRVSVISSTLYSTYTSLATVFSSTGNATLSVPPTGKRWVLKDLIFSSLATSYPKVMNGDKDVTPYLNFSPNGGAVMNFGHSGLQGDVNKSLGIGLNGSATISVMVNLRFE